MLKKTHPFTFMFVESSLKITPLKSIEQLLKNKEILHLTINYSLSTQVIKLLQENPSFITLKIYIPHVNDEIIQLINVILKENTITSLEFIKTNSFRSFQQIEEGKRNLNLDLNENNSLKYIDFSIFTLKKADLKSLQQLLNRNKNLETLKVTSIDIEQKSDIFDDLVGATSVKTLEFPSINGEVIYEFLHHHRYLENFNGFSMKINYFMKYITIKTNPYLKTLGFKFLPCRDYVDYSQTSIQNFVVNYNYLNDKEDYLHKNLVNYSNLKSICVYNIKDPPLQNYSDILKSNFIEKLDFHFTIEDHQSSGFYKELGTNKSLRSFRIDLLSDYQKDLLGESLRMNSYLTELKIVFMFNPVENKEFLKKISYNTSLIRLDLDCFTFQNEDVKIFSEFIDNREMESLRLCDCIENNNLDYTDIFNSIKNSRTLKSLEILETFNENLEMNIPKIIENNISIKSMKINSNLKDEDRFFQNLSNALAKNKSLTNLTLQIMVKNQENYLLLKEGLFYHLNLKSFNYSDFGICDVIQRNQSFINNYYNISKEKLKDLNFNFK